MGGTFASPEKGRLIVGKTYKLKHPKCYLHFYQDTQEWHIYHRPPFATAKVVSLSKLPQGINKELTGDIMLRVLPEVFIRSGIDTSPSYRIGCTLTCGEQAYPRVIASAYFSSSHHDREYFKLNENLMLLKPNPELLSEVQV